MPLPTPQELDYLGYRMFAPCPALRRHVQNYWLIDCAEPLIASHSEYLHPDGGTSLVFNFGDPLRLNRQPQATGCLLGGPATHSAELQLTGRVRAVGIRFLPGMAYPFLQLPMDRLTEQQPFPAELNRQLPASQLLDQLAEEHSDAERVALIDAALLDALKRSPAIDRRVICSRQLIERSKGNLSMAALAERINCSQRQLERQYRAWVGLSPKQHARLARVGHARQQLKSAGELSLAETGYQAGYYDQAHFIREFKAVVGITPGNYRARRSQRLATTQ
ncbi:AraC family transcriptional regulator [Marinobacterium arenosum]|uniref:AraC family transcriptional regulator n=1 Tax=Marinobacterium arenosum TaxID=2862496 RepID=UPI001C95DC79|nr:helix-turn-helix domain-containing protein [Marinobacterium arenosum]MBY4675824.1 helix-turn-helix domain-containing protein [Marinobacterium arenosum]